MAIPERELHPHKTGSIPTIPVALRGESILSNPRFNKGNAFTEDERKAFGLTGRLPSRVNTLNEQCERAYDQLLSRNSPIRKNTFLQGLKDQNWTLYYALLVRHLRELVPIIYTPTEAEAIAEYSHLYRRSDGLFLSFCNKDTMEEDFLEQTRGRDLELIVCTDAEAILGIGDQGVGGIGISTAKSVIYTLIGGMDPSKSLSVTLDVGTNNEKLLNDPLYVGWAHTRVRGKEYEEFVDQFVQLVHKYFPHSLLHFEDFGITNAHKLLNLYRDVHAVFNDDIQGTGAVTLACVMSAIGVSSRYSSSTKGQKLSDHRYVILGAGSAGMGIAVQLRDAMVTADGISKEEATKKFWMVDRQGLVYVSSGWEGEDGGVRIEFARNADEEWAKANTNVVNGTKKQYSLLEVVKRVKPTVLIGCSTASGAFTERVIRAMAAGIEGGGRPIILPLSNPTRLVEANPEDIMKWTEGRALVCTGSPFDSVKMKVNGKDREFTIGECNNALIYPGLGFGAILSKSRRMTDTMLIAGAKRLAALSPAILPTQSGEYEGASLLPDFEDAPKVNFEVAIAVAKQAILEGTSELHLVEPGMNKDNLEGEAGEQELRDIAAERLWVPVYGEYVFDPQGDARTGRPDTIQQHGVVSQINSLWKWITSILP